MKYIVQLSRIEMIEPLISRHIGTITIGTEKYSSGGILRCTLEGIDKIVKLVNGRMKVYVLVNQLFHQSMIEDLKQFLIQLNELNVDGIFFQDFGVLNMVQEAQLNFKMVYAPDTLNTNHQTLNTLNHLGVDMFYLSGQLHHDEVEAIVANCQAPCIVPIHGMQYIAYSKRNLLTNYFNQINKEIPVGYEEKIVIKVNNKEEYSHIYEDESGTHVYTTNELCTLGMNLPGEYGYIETLYLDNDYILEVIDAYQNNESDEAFTAKHPTHQYDSGFLEDGTVYKIEDVRKREENEKR